MKLKPYLRKKNGKTVWRVQYTDPKTGSRKYKQTTTKKEIDAWIKQFREEQHTLGKDALNILSDHRTRADFMDAYQRLSSFHVSLSEVIDFYISHHKIGSKLREVVEMYLKQKQSDGTKEVTIKNIKNGLNQLIKTFGDREINSITSNEYTDWMMGLKVSINSKIHYRTLSMGLFNWAFQRNIVEKNIIEKVPILKKQKQQVEIYDIETIQDFLSKSTDEIQLYLAIGAYAGVRPTEVSGLKWEDISDDIIHIPASVSKTNSIRNIEILPSLKPFLKNRPKSGPLFSVQDFGNSRKFKEWRSNKSWIQDGLRKTYTSYHIAAYENSGKTALQLGHEGNPRMLYNHYYKPGISKEDGKKYFGITEKKEEVSQSETGN